MERRDQVVGRVVKPRVADREHVDVLAAVEKPVILVPEDLPHGIPSRVCVRRRVALRLTFRDRTLSLGALRDLSPIPVAIAKHARCSHTTRPMKLSCAQRASASLISCQRSGGGRAGSGGGAGAGEVTGAAGGSGPGSDDAGGAFGAARRGAAAADLPGGAGFTPECADDFFGATGAGGAATLGASAAGGGGASDIAGRVGGSGGGERDVRWGRFGGCVARRGWR